MPEILNLIGKLIKGKKEQPVFPTNKVEIPPPPTPTVSVGSEQSSKKKDLLPPDRKVNKAIVDAAKANPGAPTIEVLNSASKNFPPEHETLKQSIQSLAQHAKGPATDTAINGMHEEYMKILQEGVLDPGNVVGVKLAMVEAATRMVQENPEIATNFKLGKYMGWNDVFDAVPGMEETVKGDMENEALALLATSNELEKMKKQVEELGTQPTRNKPEEDRLYKELQGIIRSARSEVGKGKQHAGEYVTKAEEALKRLINFGKSPAMNPITGHWTATSFEDFRTKVEDRAEGYVEPGSLRYFLEKDTGSYLLKPENYKARDYLFHKIIDRVVTQRNSEARDLYGLDESRDMTTFLRMVRRIEADPTGKEYIYIAKGELRGRKLGDVLAENYEVQRDALTTSHDADYYASHALGEMRSYTQAAALYKSEYGEIASRDPVINAAMHAYELALLNIKDNNNGFIPPGMIGYDPNNRTYYWDHLAEDMFHEMIKGGSVKKVKRDPVLGLPLTEDNRFILDDNPLQAGELDLLEVQKIMKLAKGFGIVTGRLLEIFANSRGPGSNHPEFAMGGFASIPYESVARPMQPLVHLFTKFRWGGEMYNNFFQQVIDPNKKMNWNNPGNVDKIYKAMVEGTLRDLLGEESERIMEMDNLNNWSGMFGPWTKFRVNDSTKGWSDKDKEWLGGGIRLAFSPNWAQELTENYMKSKGYDWVNKILHPTGINRLMEEKFHKGEYQKYMEDHEHHNALAQLMDEAYKAHTWLQMVERNPLLVARQLVLDKKTEDDVNKYVMLRHKIVEELLGINLLDDRFKEYKTPTGAVREDFKKIAILESDVASVREKLLEEQRSVQKSDFTKVFNAKRDEIHSRFARSKITAAERDAELVSIDQREQNAKDYWDKVHFAVTGEKIDWDDPNLHHATREMMEEVGVYYQPGQKNLHIDWNKVKNIKHTLHHKEYKNLDKLVLRKSNVLMASDDVVWSKMDLLNLGARNWVRRAQDLAQHNEGMIAEGDYIGKVLKPKANMEDLIKQLTIMRDAFAGDDINISWKTGYIFAEATANLFKAEYAGNHHLADSPIGKVLMLFRPASRMEKMYTTFYANNWTSNERRKWAGMLLQERIIPPNYLGLDGTRYDYNIHRLEKQIDATDFDVVFEIVSLGLATAALLMLLYGLSKGVTEEQGGGGGGGGGGHGGH